VTAKLSAWPGLSGDGGSLITFRMSSSNRNINGRAIGKQLMNKIMDYIRAHANNNSVIGLMSAKGKEAFYTRYGFMIRPDDRLGSGMTMW